MTGKWSLRRFAIGLGLDKIKWITDTYRFSASLRQFIRGYRYARQISPPEVPMPTRPPSENALESYFDAHTEGPGIFKWRHYFEVYDRHLSRFRGQPVSIVEIGVAGGGSMQMWRDYFGPDSHVYGIDVDPSCLRFQGEGVEVFIGDQSDPAFWREFLARSPVIDVVVDDGSHEALHQAVTLELLLPHIRPGGVYICEDIHGPFQPFQSFVDGFTRLLSEVLPPEMNDPTDALHRQVTSVHRYPCITVIEKETYAPNFESLYRGSEWPSAWEVAESG